MLLGFRWRNPKSSLRYRRGTVYKIREYPRKPCILQWPCVLASFSAKSWGLKKERTGALGSSHTLGLGFKVYGVGVLGFRAL